MRSTIAVPLEMARTASTFLVVCSELGLARLNELLNAAGMTKLFISASPRFHGAYMEELTDTEHRDEQEGDVQLRGSDTVTLFMEPKASREKAHA